jgi:hypothetical protein
MFAVAWFCGAAEPCVFLAALDCPWRDDELFDVEFDEAV